MAIFTIEGPRVGYPGKSEFKTGDLTTVRAYTEAFPRDAAIGGYPTRLEAAIKDRVDLGRTILGLLGIMKDEFWFLHLGDEVDTEIGRRAAVMNANAAFSFSTQADHFKYSKNRILIPTEHIDRKGGFKVLIDHQNLAYTCSIKYRD